MAADTPALILVKKGGTFSGLRDGSWQSGGVHRFFVDCVQKLRDLKGDVLSK